MYYTSAYCDISQQKIANHLFDFRDFDSSSFRLSSGDEEGSLSLDLFPESFPLLMRSREMTWSTNFSRAISKVIKIKVIRVVIFT